MHISLICRRFIQGSDIYTSCSLTFQRLRKSFVGYAYCFHRLDIFCLHEMFFVKMEPSMILIIYRVSQKKYSGLIHNNFWTIEAIKLE